MMRIVVSISLLLVLALRTVQPAVDYVVNYHYISTQLCENKSKPELQCNGKCYVKKEFLKSTESQSAKEVKISLKGLDVFVLEDFFDFRAEFYDGLSRENNYQHFFDPFLKTFYEDFFHPPLV